MPLVHAGTLEAASCARVAGIKKPRQSVQPSEVSGYHAKVRDLRSPKRNKTLSLVVVSSTPSGLL